MSDLLGLILSNLIPIIIVVSVAIRIVTGIKKSAASRERGNPAAVSVSRRDNDDGDNVWSRLKPDDDGEEERGPYQASAEQSRPLLKPPRKPVISAAPVPVFAQPLEPAAEKPGPAVPAPGPLDHLNKFSPLRRAVILAEILGPPRGLSNFPAE
jgi:hypothetical protein